METAAEATRTASEGPQEQGTPAGHAFGEQLTGRAAVGSENANRWVRAGHADDGPDTDLACTSLRWNGGFWYVISAVPGGDRDGRPIAGRVSGPYETVEQAEEQVCAETGVQVGQWGRDLNDNQWEAVYRVMREGLVHRLYAEAHMWVQAVGTLAAESWAFNPQLDMYEGQSRMQENYDRHNAVVKAADAYRVWREN